MRESLLESVSLMRTLRSVPTGTNGATLRPAVVGRRFKRGLVCANATGASPKTKDKTSSVRNLFSGMFLIFLLFVGDGLFRGGVNHNYRAARPIAASERVFPFSPSNCRVRWTLPSDSKMYADGASRMMMSCKRIKPYRRASGRGGQPGI